MHTIVAISNTQLDQVNCCCLKLLLLIKFAMHSIENKHAQQEETSVEDTVTVSLREYQMMQEALEVMERKKSLKLK